MCMPTFSRPPTFKAFSASSGTTVHTGQDAQRLIRWMSSDPRMIDVEGRLEEMNKWGIDMQILSVPFHGALVQDREAAVELAKLANDVVVQVCPEPPGPIPGVPGDASPISRPGSGGV